MNKRRRDILAALEPAIAHALFPGNGGAPHGERKSVPGLALHARVSAEAPAELLIYGPISNGGGWDGGISASDVAAVLREAGPGPINVRINSPGGDVFQGVAIHSLLARHPGAITAHVDGLAASAASFIMLAADHIVMARGGFVMIHDGMTGPYGNAKTIRRAADLLDMVSESIADMYAERAGEDAGHWRALMTQNEEDGTWFKGPDALTAGLVDALTEAPDEDEETLVWDRLATWKDRLPAALAAELPEPKPEPEEDEKAEPDDGEEEPKILDASDAVLSDEDAADFAHRMSMWAFMNQNGHAARKGNAL